MINNKYRIDVYFESTRIVSVTLLLMVKIQKV